MSLTETPCINNEHSVINGTVKLLTKTNKYCLNESFLYRNKHTINRIQTVKKSSLQLKLNPAKKAAKYAKNILFVLNSFTKKNKQKKNPITP